MARFAEVQSSLGTAINVAVDVANFDTQVSFTILDSDNPGLSVSQMVNGIVVLSEQTSSQSVSTPSAGDIIAVIPNAQAGSSFDFTLMNRNEAGGDADISAGSGVSLVGDTAVPVAQTQFFKGFVVTVSPPSIALIGLLGAAQMVDNTGV